MVSAQPVHNDDAVMAHCNWMLMNRRLKSIHANHRRHHRWLMESCSSESRGAGCSQFAVVLLRRKLLMDCCKLEVL